jgi:hypothetical protein
MAAACTPDFHESITSSSSCKSRLSAARRSIFSYMHCRCLSANNTQFSKFSVKWCARKKANLMHWLFAVYGRFRSNGPDADRSVSRFTSLRHGTTDSCRTGPPAVYGPAVLNIFKNFCQSLSPSVRCEPRTKNGPVRGPLGAELMQGGGAKPNVCFSCCAVHGWIAADTTVL